MEVCPTDVTRASVERVWELVTNPSGYQEWVDAKVIEAPSRALQIGDRVLFTASLGLRLSWTVFAIDPLREFGIDVALPFGMANHETIVISKLAEGCRVTFN